MGQALFFQKNFLSLCRTPTADYAFGILAADNLPVMA